MNGTVDQCGKSVSLDDGSTLPIVGDWDVSPGDRVRVEIRNSTMGRYVALMDVATLPGEKRRPGRAPTAKEILDSRLK